MSVCEVRLWGTAIGAVTWDSQARVGSFAYAEPFLKSGVEPAPLEMPLGPGTFRFPELARSSFHGLPGLVADSLPDRFGNTLIDAWLRSQGRSAADFDPVERLAYTGTRGMGALEYWPAVGPDARSPERLEVDALVALASDVLAGRAEFRAQLEAGHENAALTRLLSVGTSAGGARAKAVVAWNPTTDELRSGQADAPAGFEHWLLKFDGVSGNRDKELADPKGYGQVEYAYFLMARAAGITMQDCRLLEEGGRHHFMTRRFDRVAGTDPHTGEPRVEKLHQASLAGLAHLDFNLAGAHSYEGAFDVCRALGLPKRAHEELFRRMLFNVFARNQDDHVKNIAFLMDKAGAWSLAPAFDLTFAFNPAGAWTHKHQMTLNGKREGFGAADFAAVARHAGLKQGRDATIEDEVRSATAAWRDHAEAAGMPADWAERIGRELR
jgi:serine/threonine-protein kinase HipA